MSNTKLVTKTFRSQKLRSISVNGITCVVAADACKILYDTKGKATHRISKLDSDEVFKVSRALLNEPTGGRRIPVITESGLSKLIKDSDKEIARPFQAWAACKVFTSTHEMGAHSARKENLDLTSYEDIVETSRKLQLAMQAKMDADTPDTDIRNLTFTLQTYCDLRREHLSTRDRKRLDHEVQTLLQSHKEEIEKISVKMGGQYHKDGRPVYANTMAYPFPIIHHAAEELGVFDLPMDITFITAFGDI